MKSALALSLLLAAATLAPTFAPSSAEAAKPRCEWKGDKDPFTGEDARHVYESYFFGTVSYLFFPAKDDDTVPLEVRVKYGAATQKDWTLPVKLLLVDGTVIELPPTRAVAGSVQATSDAVTTYFEIPITLPASEVEKIYKAGGVTQVRFDFPDGNDYDMKFKKKDQTDLATLAWCSINGAK